jgi:SAM-dependent methyltransferase
MPVDPNQSYLRPYCEALERHGPGFEATLWASRDAQRLRFDVMIDLADFEDCTIVDAGCGTGDFAARLVERSVPFARYLGIDALAELIESARRRNLDPVGGRVCFQVGDLLSHSGDLERYEADYFCFSGTLNTMDESVARQLVHAAFGAAARGVVFNFLSDRCDEQLLARDLWPARRFDTLAWLDWALALGPLVSFRQDYLEGHDATIVIGKV